MAKDYIGIFDVIGPEMIGPSSSHTSGAATISWMARQIFTGNIDKVTFTLYGSFAETYKGHGNDRALLGGILGFRPNKTGIRSAFKNADAHGLKYEYIVDKETEVSHPNTVDILMESADGHVLLIRGESLGGGRVRITRINDIAVDFTGEFSTMIVMHRNLPGMIAYTTTQLAEHRINIANMRSFRDEGLKTTITVVEAEDFIPEEIKEKLLEHEHIMSVDLIEL